MIANSFIFFGLVFFFFGTIGIIRFPDIFTRLQASSKCEGAGMVALFIGLIILEGFNIFSLRIFIITFFLLITNPVSTHAIARSAVIRGIRPWRKEREERKEEKRRKD